MKLTCMMIVAVLFLTAWTFVAADDSKNALQTIFSKARGDMENPDATKLDDKKWCALDGELCVIPIVGTIFCCSGICFIYCV
uniref:Conotoxin n=1 Tax=Conus betulinus TaxID=89764 RepID=A0A142C1K9_CONBE|nr:conotoxin [Conus betulinus]